MASLHLLALAETTEGVPSIARQYQADFDEATRVGDGFALGMRSLALGRWHVGTGGLALAQSGNRAIALQGLEYLEQAGQVISESRHGPVGAFLDGATGESLRRPASVR